MPPPILEGCPLDSTLNGLRPISDHGTMPPGGIIPGIHMDRTVHTNPSSSSSSSTLPLISIAHPSNQTLATKYATHHTIIADAPTTSLGTYTCANRTWNLTSTVDKATVDKGRDDNWSSAECVDACKSCMYGYATKGLVGGTCEIMYGMWRD
jgi:hypothetical protein